MPKKPSSTETGGDQTQLHWPSILELGVAADYEGICACPDTKVESALAQLQKTCGNDLPSYYQHHLGRNEIRRLRTKLHFAAAVLVDQVSSAKRETCEHLRNLRGDGNEGSSDFPSLATIYRCVRPLKVWLKRRCGSRHDLSLKKLQADKRPLLLLTDENLEAIVHECKSFRKFEKNYRPRQKSKNNQPRENAGDSGDHESGSADTDSDDPTTVLTARAEVPKESQPGESFMLIRGMITAEAQKAIIVAVNGTAEVVLLRGPDAERAGELIQQVLDANPGK